MKGNKGEWAEPYVAVNLIAEGKVYIADADDKKNDNEWLIILEVIRNETRERKVSYVLDRQKSGVDVSVNDNKMLIGIPVKQFAALSEALKKAIQEGQGSFGVGDEIDGQLREYGFHSIKAKNSDKSDIYLSTIDARSGITQTNIGFSIKSSFGSPATLFNTGKGSACVFRLENMTDDMMRQINAICTKKGRVDYKARWRKMQDENIVHSFIGYGGNGNFEDSLDILNPRLPKLLAYILDELFSDRCGVRITEVMEHVIEQNPLQIKKPEQKYPYMMKAFLYASYGGLTASLDWDGKTVVKGGYLHVDRNGEVLAYYALESESFKDYLYTHCRFEFPSTDEKHGNFGSVYKVDKEYRFNLNFSIRF